MQEPKRNLPKKNQVNFICATCVGRGITTMIIYECDQNHIHGTYKGANRCIGRAYLKSRIERSNFKKQEIARLVNSGTSYKEAAKIVGLSVSQTKNLYARSLSEQRLAQSCQKPE